MFEVCAPYIWEPDAASSEFKQAPVPLENIMILGLHSPPPPRTYSSAQSSGEFEKCWYTALLANIPLLSDMRSVWGVICYTSVHISRHWLYIARRGSQIASDTCLFLQSSVSEHNSIIDRDLTKSY